MARVHENPRGRTILSRRDADTIRQLLDINETRLRLALREAIKEAARRPYVAPETTAEEEERA